MVEKRQFALGDTVLLPITGETTNDEFNEMMSTTKAPMIELEIPGSMIFTIPITTVNQVIKDMTALADKWREIMDNIQWLAGKKFARPMRYVTDVQISAGIIVIFYFPIIGKFTSKIIIHHNFCLITFHIPIIGKYISNICNYTSFQVLHIQGIQ